MPDNRRDYGIKKPFLSTENVGWDYSSKIECPLSR